MAANAIVRRVALKEIRLFFASPVAWLFLAAFIGFTLFTFFWVEAFFARNIADVRPLFEWMPIVLIFLCSAVTMRMWSDERRNGTLEHILTQPVRIWRFVLGKFCACLVLLLLALIGTVPLPVTVALIADLDWGPVLAGYMATVLLGAAYLAVGMFVSARTDNAIVSLMGAIALCGLLYLPGSSTVTVFFDDSTGEFLRLFGSGARFDSIARGVIDLRDLFYYLSLLLGFLALNVYSLETQRWAHIASARHRHWRCGLVLLLLNLVLANIWVHKLDGPRLDTTRGQQFSLSRPTLDFLTGLEEPLLIRGFFSEKTHPSLAPLVPQLRDLLQEYQVSAKGDVRVEIMDPADDPAVEEELNKRYGISAHPFQVADRHQATLVNAYFNILVSYGNQHETLGFTNLVETRHQTGTDSEIQLRNPEYGITSAIKAVLSRYRMGGNLFDRIEEPVEFIGYVSGDSLLPEQLRSYKAAINAQLQQAAEQSGGKFSVRFIAPEAHDGIVARQIAQEWGFKPMVMAPGDAREFYFYLTLADTRQVVQLPTGDFDATTFRLLLDSGLKRFARGLVRTVALSVPSVDPQMSQYQLGGPTFDNLEKIIGKEFSVETEDLSDGMVAPETDVLAVVAPHQLDSRSVFAIDQFLMHGGTVVVATSPYTSENSAGELRLQDWDNGLLGQWLAHHGLTIENTLVLDKQSALSPAPVKRQSGEREFRDVQLVRYPYFLDLRPPGLTPEHPVTAGLPYVTMAWASPIRVQAAEYRKATTLLQSSADAWLSDSRDITPSLETSASDHNSKPAGVTAPYTLGVSVQGRFDSFFTSGANTTAAGERGENARIAQPLPTVPLPRSPESARIVLFAANDFMDDQILKSQVAASGTRYLGPLELFMNTLHWALQDDQLLTIRSRAHFARTLPTMERRAQEILEYFNYGLAIFWLLFLALAQRFLSRRRKQRLVRELQL